MVGPNEPMDTPETPYNFPQLLTFFCHTQVFIRIK